MKKPIPKDEWEWFGKPGHLIVSDWCQFHLCTKVGRYLISTVGQYFPDEPVREIFAKSRGANFMGMGDERRRDYMRKIGYEEVGFGRKFETMVFMAGKSCDVEQCPCGGIPKINGSELECQGYNDPKEANSGHLKLCEEYAKK